MGCKFICDGCGKEKEAEADRTGWHKPASWFERGDEEGTQVACSRDCIKTIAKKTGKTDLVIPL